QARKQRCKLSIQVGFAAGSRSCRAGHRGHNRQLTRTRQTWLILAGALAVPATVRSYLRRERGLSERLFGAFDWPTTESYWTLGMTAAVFCQKTPAFWNKTYPVTLSAG